jgi:hypothetical protein
MPEPTARLAAKLAWQRMRRLLFPFSLRRWAALFIGQRIKSHRHDPAIAELLRIRPYYRGTRTLTMAGLLLILLAFVLPFSVIFVTWDAFVIILVLYAVLFIVSSLTGMVVQSGMDAVLGLQHERKLSFGQALRAFLAVLRSNTDLTLGYLSIKMAIDFSLSTLALCFFLPALLTAMALMVRVTNAVRAGVDLGSDPALWLIAIVMLAFLGLVATLLITLPAATFYGYYTEEAVKMMKEVHPEAAHPEQAR